MNETAIRTSGESTPKRSALPAILLILMHAIAALAWWGMMPKGFPAFHARWWSNQIITPTVAAVLAIGLMSQIGKRKNTDIWLLGLAFAWLSAGLTGAILFPQSGGWRSIAFLVIAAILISAAARMGIRVRSRRSFVAAVLGSAVGVGMIAAQKAPPSSTHPLNVPIPEVTDNGRVSSVHRGVSISQNARVWPASQQIEFHGGSLALNIEPMLTFVSRSPDGCWTIFAPRSARVSGDVRVKSLAREQDAMQIAYTGDYPAVMTARAKGDRELEIAAFAELSNPVYSHVNSFCRLTIDGHARLFLEFSPCPGRRIEVLPSDYPIGRPARAAYKAADGVFRVVQATSGEKGPFKELARGTLQRGQPLIITLIDNQTPMVELTLHDWSSQASTEPSPTAGWGATMNAIEFSLIGETDRDAAAIYITLAGTSLGRGWDSVGHASGVYRNRMTITALNGSAD